MAKELIEVVLSEMKTAIANGQPLDKVSREQLWGKAKVSKSKYTAQEYFRLCMGALKSEVNDINWWSSSYCYVNELFSETRVTFFEETSGFPAVVEIGMISAGSKGHGFFYIFFLTILKICKEYGIKEIQICNRAEEGFWEHHGFKGPRSRQVLKV